MKSESDEIFNKMCINIQYREDYFITKNFRSLLSSQATLELRRAVDFIDELFPPGLASLYSGKTYFSEKMDILNKSDDLNEIKNEFHWKKLRFLLKSGSYFINKVFVDKDGIKSDLSTDIKYKESFLQNNYFTSLLKLWAEKPSLIEFNFPYKDIPKNGLFILKVFIHGEETLLAVDDHIPCIEIDEWFVPSFLRISTRSMNIWPLLLEKAWAKVNLSYENTIFGRISDAFEFLSPAPYEIINHDYCSNEYLLSKLVEAENNNFTIFCDSTIEEENFYKSGIVNSNAHRILSSKYIDLIL